VVESLLTYPTLFSDRLGPKLGSSVAGMTHGLTGILPYQSLDDVCGLVHRPDPVWLGFSPFQAVLQKVWLHLFSSCRRFGVCHSLPSKQSRQEAPTVMEFQ
jgi:hypothetical protein